MPQEEIERADGRAGAGRAQRRAAEGRRPVRVRPRRRGGRGAAPRPGSSSRSCPGSPPGSPRRLRRHPGHPPRRRLGGRLRHRPRGPGQGRDARSTGRRSRASRARSSSTWGSSACREIAERLIAAGRDPDEPAAAVERGTHAGPAHRDRDARRARRRRSAEAGLGAAGDRRSSARSRRGARRSPGSSAARCTAARVVVTRARAQASGLAATLRGARRRGGRAAGDPDRAAARLGRGARRGRRRSTRYALVCLTSPNGVRLLFEALAEAGRDARALANATVAAIGPGTAAALAEHGIGADVVPERSSPRRWSRRCADVDVAGRPGPRRPRRRGPRRAPRRARERGRRGRRRGPLRDRRARSPTRRRSRPRRTPTTSPSPPPRPCATWSRRSATASRRGARVVSIGPVTSDTAREPGSRSTSRPSATTSTAWSRRCSPTRPRAEPGVEPWRARSPSSPTTATTTSSRASAGR